MYGYQLFNCIQSDVIMRQHFKTITNPTKVTQNLENTHQKANKSFYILNPSLDRTKQPAENLPEHWMLLKISKKGIIYFDPLGASPIQYLPKKNIKASQIWKRFIRRSSFSSNIGHPVQSHYSVKCGFYVLYVFYFLSRGHSLSDILKAFSYHNLKKNENIVNQFVKQTFSIPLAYKYVTIR